MGKQMMVGNRSNHDLKVKIEFQRTIVLKNESTCKGCLNVLGIGVGAAVGGANVFQTDRWHSDFQPLQSRRHIELHAPSKAEDVCFITIHDETTGRDLCTNKSWETGRYIVIDEAGDVCRGANDKTQPWRKDVKGFHY